MGYLLGRGLVEPIDDMRATKRPSNPALLDSLADDFVKNGYNLKQLMRTIMTSRLYQLDSQPTTSNASDRRFYSHYRVKRLSPSRCWMRLIRSPERKPSSATSRWGLGPSSSRRRIS